MASNGPVPPKAPDPAGTTHAPSTPSALPVATSAAKEASSKDPESGAGNAMPHGSPTLPPPGTPYQRADAPGARSSPVSTPGSGKRVKRAKAKVKGTDRKKGNSEDAKSFVGKIWEAEAECAAYLGYTHIDDFRRFAISPLVLTPFNKLTTEGRNVRQNSVLEVLRDCAEEMKSDKDPEVAYPKDHTGRAAYRVALVMAQTRRAIENAHSGSYTCTSDEIEEACKTFDKQEKKSCPRIDPTVELVLPKLGPFQHLGEDDLEAYNRVFALIKYVQFSARTPWEKRFESPRWDQRVAVTQSHVPAWMQRKDDTTPTIAPDAPLKPADIPVPSKPAIKMRVVWKYKANTPEARAYRDLVEEEGIELPSKEQEVNLQPAARREHVFDQVRLVYGLASLQAQIKSLRLNLEGDSEDDPETDIETTTADWSRVQTALWETTWNASKSALWLIVRPAKTDEVIFESNLPLEVEQILTIKDGDVHPIAVPEVDTNVEVHPSALVTDGYVEALSGGSRERKVLNPAKMFKGRREAMLAFYDGHDPTTEKGLLAWQREASYAVTREDERDETQNSAKFQTKGVQMTPAEAEALENARSEGDHAAFNLAEASRNEDTAEAHHFNLAQIHTGTSKQVGPPLEPCALALELTAFVAPHGQTMYRSSDPNLEKCAFYPWQVTGACAALIGAIGYVPVRADAPENVKAAADSLRGLRIGGKLIGDQTGLGKTIILLANYYYVNHHVDLDTDGNPYYRMMVLVVPAGVLKQWADEIIDRWPSLQLLISYDDTGLNSQKYKPYYLSATALKAFPDQKRWPAQYRYIFDTTDPRTGRTIMLTSNETHVSRTLRYKHVPAGFDADGNPMLDDSGKPEVISVPYSILKGYISRAGADEGHKLKDRTTRRWKSFHDMAAPINWVLGATPMSNRSVDFIAQLQLIWTGAEALLANDPAAEEWVNTRAGSLAMFADGEELADPLDNRRLGFLHPLTVNYLLERGTKVEIARYFPLCEDLIAVKRFMGSRLPLRFGSEDTFNMSETMRPYDINTITCKFRPYEMPAHQALHRDASRRFVDAGIKAQKALTMTNAFGGSKAQVIYPVAEMRELLITAMSTKLRAFHETCKGLNTDTLVETLQELRGQGFDGFRFVRFMCEKQNLALPTTATGYLQSLCEGSPLIRGLIYKICKDDKFLKPRKHGKFLVTEEVPLNALFLEWGLNMLGVETAVFHSGLTQKERNDLQDEFNNPMSSLACVVIFYNVGGVGINLWQDSHTVFMATPSTSEANEKQAYGRVIRAPQPFVAHIFKFYVEQTIFAYREFRKRDKYLVELATRAYDPDMRSLIVKCLNLHQETARKAQQDPRNAHLMQRIEETEAIEEAKGELLVAKAVHDKIDLEPLPLVTGKRVRKPVKRFQEEFEYYGDSDLEEEAGKGKKKIKNSKMRVLEEEEDFLDVSEESSGSDDEISEYEDDETATPRVDDHSDTDASGDEGPQDTAAAERKRKRAEKLEAWHAMRAETQEDEAVRQLRLLLSADVDKVYTDKDLENEATLERGLELTHCLRVGQSLDRVPSVHISYDAISHSFNDEVKKDVMDDPAKKILSRLLSTSKDHAPDHALERKVRPVEPAPRALLGIPDYNRMLAVDLKKLCMSKGFDMKGKTKKAQFIQLLNSGSHEVDTATSRVDKEERKGATESGTVSDDVLSQWQREFTELTWKARSH